MKSVLPQGAKGHGREAILRALLAAIPEKISTFTLLNRRLKSDIQFRYLCGFPLTKQVPSVSTFSRVLGIILGDILAIDSTAVNAYEKKQPKSRCQDTGNASWGAKFDSYGNEVTSAHVNDGDMGPKLIEKVPSQPLSAKLAYVIMDAGYDQLKNYEAARSYGA